MKLDSDEVRAIADEARLSLTGEELAKATRYIGDFLDMVDRFKELDLKSVEPFCFAEATECPLREDAPASFDHIPDILAGRMEGTTDSLFKVPRIVGEA